MVTKMEKTFYKLMSNAVYSKKMKNLRSRIDVRLVSNEKDYLKWTSKRSYIPHKKFDIDLVTICKRKVIFTLKKPAYVRMCILDLSKVLMYEFHYDYVNCKYGNNSKILFADTDSLMYAIKTEDIYEDFSKDKEMFDFSNYSAKSKYYDDSNKLVVSKMKDETVGVAIKEFVGSKPKIYSFLADGSSEHKQTKSVNKNAVAATSYNKYKDVLLNNKCLRHSVNRI